MQRQRRIDIQLYKEVAVEKKRREINLVYIWKLNFWPFFPPLHTERDYLATLFQKKVIKTRQKLLWWFSDDAIRQQSLALVSAQAIQCVVENLL